MALDKRYISIFKRFQNGFVSFVSVAYPTYGFIKRFSRFRIGDLIWIGPVPFLVCQSCTSVVFVKDQMNSPLPGPR